MDTLTDDMVADAFTEQKIPTKKRIWLHMYGRYSKSRPQIPSLRQGISAVEDELLDKCKVTIPDEYLDARLQEYQYEFEADNCNDTQTLEQYAKNNSTTVDDMKNSGKN